MYKYLGCIFFATFMIAGCKTSPKLETVEATDSAGYTERYSRRKSDFAKQGLYVKIDPQGNKVEEAQFSGDTLHGFRILYYENGDTQIVESYQMGGFEGDYKVYYPGGQLKMAGKYEDNVMTGKWKVFYENGGLKEEVTFKNNQENGPFVEYHPNGNLKAEGTYLNGDYEQGELKLYDESGRHIKTMMCEKGVCRTTWESEKSDQ